MRDPISTDRRFNQPFTIATGIRFRCARCERHSQAEIELMPDKGMLHLTHICISDRAVEKVVFNGVDGTKRLTERECRLWRIIFNAIAFNDPDRFALQPLSYFIDRRIDMAYLLAKAEYNQTNLSPNEVRMFNFPAPLGDRGSYLADIKSVKSPTPRSGAKADKDLVMEAFGSMFGDYLAKARAGIEPDRDAAEYKAMRDTFEYTRRMERRPDDEKRREMYRSFIDPAIGYYFENGSYNRSELPEGSRPTCSLCRRPVWTAEVVPDVTRDETNLIMTCHGMREVISIDRRSYLRDILRMIAPFEQHRRVLMGQIEPPKEPVTEAPTPAVIITEQRAIIAIP